MLKELKRFLQKCIFGDCDPCVTLTEVKGRSIDRGSQCHAHALVSGLYYVMETGNKDFSGKVTFDPYDPNDLGSPHATVSFVEGLKVNHIYESRGDTMYPKVVETFFVKMHFWPL